MTNFWEAVKNFKPAETKQTEYRLYYNESGEPLFYTTEQLDGNYIVIDEDTYHEGNYHGVRVVDDQLQKLSPVSTVKLTPTSKIEGTCCHSNNVAIVSANKNGQYWKLKTHEYR